MKIAQIDPRIKDVELRSQQTGIRPQGALQRQTYWVIGSVGHDHWFHRLLDRPLASLPG